MEHPVAQAIRALCDRAGARYHEIHHAPARSAVACAHARGTDVRSGAKSLVLKVGRSDFRLFVLSGAFRIETAALRGYFQEKRLRLASVAELQTLTGLTPGTVPPFGKPILPLDLFVDPSLLANTHIAFTLGRETCSLVLAVEDYVRMACPLIFPFAISRPEQEETAG